MVKFREVNFRLYFLIFLTIFFALSLFKNIAKVREATERIENARAKVEKLKEEETRLGEELRKVQSDEFMQSQLRDKLGLAKEGETIVVLPDPEILKELTPRIPEEEDVLPDPIWKRWAKLFGL